MFKHFLVLLFGFSIVTLSGVHAEDGLEKSGADPLPEVLASGRANTREKYVYQLFSRFRGAAGRDNVLEQSDIDLKRKIRAARERARTIQELVSHDLDGDGSVTRAEIEMALDASGSRSQSSHRKVSAIFAMDLDGDGKVTLAEAMTQLSVLEKRMDRIARPLDVVAQLLALDPDGDKRLTANELEAIARAAFSRFDKDGDGVLSKDEALARQITQRSLRKRKRSTPSSSSVAQCNLPKAEKDWDVVLMSAYEAGALSNVTVAGQDNVTETSSIFIEPGDRPLYIVASSFTANIWRFSGSVERVKRFVAIPVSGRGKHPRVGVVGLARDRISFLPSRSCMRYFSDPKSGQARSAKAVVEAALGQPVTKIVSAYSLGSAKLPSGESASNKRRSGKPGLVIDLGDGDNVVVNGRGVVRLPGGGRTNLSRDRARSDYKTKRAPSVPPGVDRATFNELYRFNPGGVVEIEPDSVVSPGPVARYGVLPQQAGLVQLMKEGKVERLSDGVYLIKKPIARYPAGLNGAHSVKFMLGKGVGQPKGSPGHSCVISEETGKAVGTTRRRGCR